jgi:ABC-2 type transport system ATP-binding protein
VLVSHNENDLERFCNRGIYLKGGTVVADGPIGDVLDFYRNDTEQDDDE